MLASRLPFSSTAPLRGQAVVDEAALACTLTMISSPPGRGTAAASGDPVGARGMAGARPSAPWPACSDRLDILVVGGAATVRCAARACALATWTTIGLARPGRRAACPESARPYAAGIIT